MSDNITIQELLNGKSTIIKNKEFYPTRNYVEPFLERMSKFTTNFKIQIKVPDQMTGNRENTDLTYNRVLIQAVLPPEHSIDNHDEVIGFLYGIDVKKPVVKIFRSMENQACTNLCVFNPKWLNVQELVPGEPINFNPIKELMESVSDFPLRLKALKETYVDRDSRKRMLGEWVDGAMRDSQDYGFGKVKIAVSLPIDAYKALYINQDSEYYIPQGIDPSMFDLYNAFTQIVTEDRKDLLNKFEKTMIINKLLGVSF